MDAISRHSSPGTERSGLRRGFSLIELLVALILIDVGLLALTAVTIGLVRQRTAVHARVDAIRAASARLEWLGAGPCQSANGSTSPSPMLTEHWAMQPGANATRDLTDSVSYGPGVAHAVVLRTRLPC